MLKSVYILQIYMLTEIMSFCKKGNYTVFSLSTMQKMDGALLTLLSLRESFVAATKLQEKQSGLPLLLKSHQIFHRNLLHTCDVVEHEH